MTQPERIVFFGTPELAVASLRALLEAGEQVVGVVTQPDRPKGRSPLPSPPPVKMFAQEHGLRVLQPEKIRSGSFPDELRELAPGIAIVVAYGRILPPAILETPRLGCINVHASLLPRYRGAAPIQHALANAERQTGITIMQMDEGLDTGPILHQLPLTIGPDDTAADLHDRLARLGGQALLEALVRLRAGRLEPKPQDDSLATLAPPLRKEDGHVDWRLPAARVHAFVRAVYPWPGAFATVAGHHLKLFPFRELGTERSADAAPGIVLEVSEGGLVVACGQGWVRITEVQLEGRKRMPVADFLRGFTVRPGDVMQGKETGA